MASLPPWANEIIGAYESGASSQFILYGNLHDRFPFVDDGKVTLGSLRGFFMEVLLARFDVVLNYDLGNGIRIEKGRKEFADWPGFAESKEFPRSPRGAIEFLTRYFRYGANLASLGKACPQIACIVQGADLLAPAGGGVPHHELSALAMLLREWGTDPALVSQALATFLLTENLNDLHPLLATNSRAAKVKIPLPSKEELKSALEVFGGSYPKAMEGFRERLEPLAAQMRGASMVAIENRLKRSEHRREPLLEKDLAEMRKQLVEQECDGLIEFIEPTRSLEDFDGQPHLKEMLRQDFALWRENDLEAMPKGYLICGPVGTGKTYLVECLAGEAAVPVVKLKNFRDRWIGSTEGNLERVFRLLQALGRCFVFVDEADQALGRRESGAGDSGLSGRVYSMFATEMSRPENRGRIVWVLATSRPDLVEVDLKRPGRIDVKVPIFPTASPAEALSLLRALCRRRGLDFAPEALASLEAAMPEMLTAGAADALAMKIYRVAKLEKLKPEDAARECLSGYQNPVPIETLREQIALAVREASDIDFVPEIFRTIV